MSQDLILSLVTFALVTAMTPGPNNMILLTSGVNFGFNRTRSHILGVTIGFTIMILAVGLGVGRIFTAWPMVALSVAANYVSAQNFKGDLAVLAAIFLLVSLLSTVTWTFFGASLRPLLRKPPAARVFNVAMALALVASLWPIVREMI